MPRKAVRSSKEILEVLKGLPIFNPDGSLKKELHIETDSNYRVWNEASKKLTPMSAHYVYILVQRNSHNLFNDAREYHFPQFVIKSVQQEQRTESPTEIDDSDQSSEHSESESIPIQEEESIPDEYDTLIRMKHNIVYYDTFRDIRLRPFSITLKSTEHRETYKMLVNADSPIGLTTIEKVAPCTRLKHYKSKTSHMISIVARVEKQLVILCQIISEKIQCSDVKFLLMDFLKDEVMYLPLRFNVGYHEGILNNVCLALNTCSFNDYNTQTLALIKKREDVTLPPVLLNIDLISILMRIEKSKSLNTVLPATRTFYLKCIISLHFVTTLEEFDAIVQSIITCLLSLYEDHNVIKEKKTLDDKIEQDQVLQVYNKFLSYKENKCSNNFDVFNDVSPTLQSTTYIDELKAKVLILKEVGKPNSLSCPDWYDEQLLFLLSSCTSWTSLLLNNADTDFVFQAIAEQQKLKVNASKMTSFLSDIVEHSRESMRNGKSIISNRSRKKTNAKQAKQTKNSEIGNNEMKNRLNEKLIYYKCEENWGGKNHCYKATKKFISDVIENGAELKLDEEKQFDKEEHKMIDAALTTSIEGFCIKNMTNEENFRKKTISMDENSNVLQACTVYSDVDCYSESANIFIDQDNLENETKAFMEDDNILQTEQIKISDKINSNELSKETFSSRSSFTPLTSKCQDHYNSSTPVGGSSLNHNYSSRDSCSNVLLEHDYSQAEKQISKTDSENVSSCIFSSYEMKLNVGGNEKNSSNHSASKLIDHQSVELVQKKCISTSSSIVTGQTVKSTTIRDMAVIKPQTAAVKKYKNKYIRSAPNFELIHSQASANRGHESVIRNAQSGLAGRRIHSVRYTIEDSSKFDVFAEIFSFAFMNYSLFKEVLLKNEMCTEKCQDSCLIQIVKNYCIRGVTTFMYEKRGILLHKYANVNDETLVIKIDETISKFFMRLMGSHFSFMVGITCLLCEKTIFLTESVIELTVFPSETLADLQIWLDLHFTTKYLCTENLCKICSAASIDDISVYYFWGHYLYIDVQQSNIVDLVNIAPQYLDVPVNANEQRHRYALVGVVTPDSQSNPMPIVYCQTLDKHWEKRNSKSKSIVKLAKLPKVKILLILYIRITPDEIYR